MKNLIGRKDLVLALRRKAEFGFRLCYAPRSVAALTAHRAVIHYRSRSSPYIKAPAKNKRPAKWLVFFLVMLLQNRSVPQVFSKSIHCFQSADRLIPGRVWELHLTAIFRGATPCLQTNLCKCLIFDKFPIRINQVGFFVNIPRICIKIK